MQPPKPRSGKQSKAGSTLAIPLGRWEWVEAWQPWRQQLPSAHHVRGGGAAGWAWMGVGSRAGAGLGVRGEPQHCAP